jgi:hypothetical protein
MFAPSTARNNAQAMEHPMVDIPDHPDVRLTRERTAEALTALGFPISPRTLATMASRGGGPPYCRFNRRAVYRWSDAVAWAESLTTPPRRSTAEADANRNAA